MATAEQGTPQFTQRSCAAVIVLQVLCSTMDAARVTPRSLIPTGALRMRSKPWALRFQAECKVTDLGPSPVR